VLKGMDVVREIAATPTGNKGPYSDVPKSTILIHQIKLNTKAL
jgi:peptidyl-prolyl cis-trans isomerase A (cyclophilin A)